MFDQVLNHVGYGDFKEYYPFNASTDFHNCDGEDRPTAAAGARKWSCSNRGTEVNGLRVNWHARQQQQQQQQVLQQCIHRSAWPAILQYLSADTANTFAYL